jgi:protease-4
LDTAAVPGLEQGRVFSGREALEHKLIDAIGGEPEVVKFLVEKRGVDGELKVVDWKPKKSESFSVLGVVGEGIARLVGVGGLAPDWLVDDPRLASLRSSGLVSVWQPSEK